MLDQFRARDQARSSGLIRCAAAARHCRRQSAARGGLARAGRDLFEALARAALFVLLALVVTQAFTRYVLNDPIGEVVTVTETYLMPGIVFFTLAALQRDDGHVRVDLLYGAWGGRTRQVADLLIAVLSTAFWVVVVYASASETLFSLRMGYEVSKDLPLPLASAIGIVPLGGTLILLRLVLQIAAALGALRAPRPCRRRAPMTVALGPAVARSAAAAGACRLASRWA